MFTKQLYEVPQAESMQINLGRPILDGSITQTGLASGAYVTFENESSFDDFFNE